MKTKFAAICYLLSAICPLTFAQGTAFTYQGRLNNNGSPANGTYDFRFRAAVDPLGNVYVGSPYLTNGVSITNGLFTSTVDFGPGIFTGSNYWLEVDVRTNGAGSYIALSPLQALTPTPYAIFANSASNLFGALSATQLSGTIPNAALPAGPNFSGTVAANNFSGNGGGLTNVNAANLNGLSSAAFWKTNGNASTTAGANFVGTTDNQPLELHVNGARALRIEPGGTNAPNVVSGHFANNIWSNVVGAVIGGGGGFSVTTGNQFSNIVSDAHGVVGGGLGNLAGNLDSDISNARYATVGGGFASSASAEAATVSGGYQNFASGNFASVGGGEDNSSGGGHTTIGGGFQNNSLGDFATISGGQQNIIYSTNATIGGGYGNSILVSGSFATVSGGANNRGDGLCATVAGGTNNSASGSFAFLGGGFLNISSGTYATVGGGEKNTNAANNATIGGGFENTILVNGTCATVGGGANNRSAGLCATVSGGTNNSASGFIASVGGGFFNLSSGPYATVGGGATNIASGGFGTVGGGFGNNALGSYATVPGGFQSSAYGNYSFAAGNRAIALHDGAFVWADSQSADFLSTANDQFLIRAAGGVGIGNNNPQAPLNVSGGGDASLAGGGNIMSGLSTGLNIVIDNNEIMARNNSLASELTINASGGNVGIGRTPTANALEVAGNASKTAAGSWLANSDARIKTDVQTISGALDTLARVRLVRFRYTDDYRATHPGVEDHDYLNVVAQEFQKVFPEDVKRSGEKLANGDDILQVDTYPLTIYSAAAIQELNQKLSEELKQKETEITELKHRLDALEQTIRH